MDTQNGLISVAAVWIKLGSRTALANAKQPEPPIIIIIIIIIIMLAAAAPPGGLFPPA
jgi:hypothetical protein